MKIQPVTDETRPKAKALLLLAFSGSTYEAELVQKLHANHKSMHAWVCIQTNRVIGYIAFTNAYHGKDVCGLHLAPMAVTPEFQRQGVGSQLIRFALRQPAIKDQTLFVLGAPAFYRKFGFEPAATPLCPFDKDNAHFLAMRNTAGINHVVGYEPEFGDPKKASTAKARKRR